MRVYRVELITIAFVAAADADDAQRTALENHVDIIDEHGIAVHQCVEVPEASILTSEGAMVDKPEGIQ